MQTLKKCLYNCQFLSRLSNTQAINSYAFTICLTNLQIIKISFFFIHTLRKHLILEFDYRILPELGH